ncbi:MAG: imidazole glycerol phosphate synthase subunit HisH [Clostridiales bacterium]|nr:imidazole glycerol phosphate synthase subunit HisH [Candidatus Crickella merdequi]
MIAIIDYGVGNLFSLQCSLAKIGFDAVVTSDKAEIEAADRIILPGVGAYGDASEKLKSTGMGEIVKNEAAKGKPVLGICLGMQLLFEKGYEYGEFDGLGLIKGKVVSMADVIPAELKLPQIGWNALEFKKECPLQKYIKEGDCVYFVHSYYATDCDYAIAATTEYGADITAMVNDGNVYGTQFHPEKSGETGLAILRAFCELEV